MADDSATTSAGTSLRRRLIAAALLALTVGAGLVVHLFAPDGAASDIAGDALYAVAAYLAVVIVLPRLRPLAAASIAAAWCTFVELFQLTGIPLQLGAVFRPVVLVLGTVFDARDLIVYLVAIVIVAVLDATVRRARRRAA